MFCCVILYFVVLCGVSLLWYCGGVCDIVVFCCLRCGDVRYGDACVVWYRVVLQTGMGSMLTFATTVMAFHHAYAALRISTGLLHV